MKTTVPNIYDYNDFRRYLVDYQKARQKVEKGFGKSEFSRRLDLPNTRSYLTDVLKGKKVTSTFIDRFIKVLGLRKDEARFFRTLVMFNQAESIDERELYFEQLISLNKTPKAVVAPEAYAYYKEWRHGAIRAILDVYDFSDNYAALARRVYPPATVKQAKESIALLRALKLIKKDGRGFYKPTDKSITTGSYVHDELIRLYQFQCMEMAQRALMKNDSRPQNISTNTISISKEGYRRLEKQLQKFKDEVRSLVHKDESPAQHVYQLNIQLFPGSS